MNFSLYCSNCDTKFLSFKSFLGGYHAKTIKKCTVITTFIFIISNLLYNLNYVYILLIIISPILIIIIFKVCLNDYHFIVKILLCSIYVFLYFTTKNIDVVFLPIFEAVFCAEMLFYAK